MNCQTTEGYEKETALRLSQVYFVGWSYQTYRASNRTQTVVAKESSPEKVAMLSFGVREYVLSTLDLRDSPCRHQPSPVLFPSGFVVTRLLRLLSLTYCSKYVLYTPAECMDRGRYVLLGTRLHFSALPSPR